MMLIALLKSYATQAYKICIQQLILHVTTTSMLNISIQQLILHVTASL